MPKLTKRLVDAADARDAEYFTWDSEIPGFGLRVPDYMRQRETLIAITRYIANKREDRAPEEAAAARILASAIQMERI